MQTALSFTTLSARGTRFRMFPNAYRNAKDSRESVRYNYITRTAQTRWCEIMSKVLLMQILRCSLKNTFLVLDFLLRLHPQWCSVCSLSIRTLCVCWCEQTASLWLTCTDKRTDTHLSLEGSIQGSYNDRLSQIGHLLTKLHCVWKLQRHKGSTDSEGEGAFSLI